MSRGALIASVGAAGCLLGGLAPVALLHAWLVAVAAGLGLSLGALTILMIHRLTGGRWGDAATPTLHRIARTLPLLLLLFVPVVLASPALFPFVGQPTSDLPARVAAKVGYLNPLFLDLRAILCAVGWLACLVLMGLLPCKPRLAPKPAAIVSLVIHAAVLTIFTTDWMQALEPEFYSTIYAMEVAGAQLLGTLALVILLLRPMGQIGGDWAKLLLAGVLGWGYLAYMQWLVVWMGDLPPEAAFYLRRFALPWVPALAVMLLAFGAIPFVVLLTKSIRENLNRMRVVAGIVLAGYVAENLWRLGPATPVEPIGYGLLIATHLLMGGVFLVALDWRCPRVEAAIG